MTNKEYKEKEEHFLGIIERKITIIKTLEKENEELKKKLEKSVKISNKTFCTYIELRDKYHNLDSELLKYELEYEEIKSLKQKAQAWDDLKKKVNNIPKIVKAQGERVIDKMYCDDCILSIIKELDL